jgi:hypothetical protein
MKLEPYWALPEVEERGLTECISLLRPKEKILEVKRKAAGKACAGILKKDAETEIVALLGFSGACDITG